MRANAQSWKHLECPEQCEDLGFEAEFSREDTPRILQGLVPEQMEDKWFIFYNAGWLYFCRSWTGFVIYGLQVQEQPTGLRISQAWVNRDTEQYGGSDVPAEREQLQWLIDALLLGKG